MARTQVATAPLRRSARNLIKEENPLRIKEEEIATPSPQKKAPSTKRRQEPSTPFSPQSSSKPKRIKTEPSSSSPSYQKKAATTTTKESTLQSRKLNSYSLTADGNSPFPSFPHPTPEACHLAHTILTRIHGPRVRPSSPPKTAPTNRAGCGVSPSVLDALVRTILSQNTSDANSTRAKLSLDAEYADGSSILPSSEPYYAAIASSPISRLERAIQCGGLAGIKSKVIMTILEQAASRHPEGRYSLDHLFQASNDEAMRELLAMKGVGPKTASCVLLFCLGRESFAVDTHVYRITGLLGWRPSDSSGCGREEAQAHLDARVPGELKYGLHVLFVGHGKVCGECKAGGSASRGGKKGGGKEGGCELRKAFRCGPEGDMGFMVGGGVKEEKDGDDVDGGMMMEKDEDEGEEKHAVKKEEE